MKYSKYNSNSINEINELFIKTFSDSEEEAEGLVIGELTNNFLTATDANDFHCFTAIENKKIVGGVFFSKMIFERGVKAYILLPMAVLIPVKHQNTL